MDIERTRKTTIFVTGPVKQVEDELAALPGEWAALDFWYHVIRDEACVTVRLIPTALMRQMALAQGVQPRPPRMQ